jgi:hypothetical protein
MSKRYGHIGQSPQRAAMALLDHSTTAADEKPERTTTVQ